MLTKLVHTAFSVDVSYLMMSHEAGWTGGGTFGDMVVLNN